MDKLLTVGQTTSTLERIRTTVDALVGKEMVLREERDRELEALNRKYDLLKARARQALDERTRKAGVALEAERERVAQAATRRLQWIDHSYERAMAALNEEAEQRRSQQKYENQKELLQANRDHDASCEAAEKTLKTFLAELGQESERFEEARERAWLLFSGYSTFKNRIQGAPEPDPNPAGGDSDEYALLEDLRAGLGRVEHALKITPQLILARLFAVIPWWLFVVLFGGIGIIGITFPQVSQSIGFEGSVLVKGSLGALGGVILAYGLGWLLARGSARSVRDDLRASHNLIGSCQESAEASRADDFSMIQQRHKDVEDRLEMAWHETIEATGERLRVGSEKLKQQRDRLELRNDAWKDKALGRLDGEPLSGSSRDRSDASQSLSQIESEQEALSSEIEGRFSEGIGHVVSEWQGQLPLAFASLSASREMADRTFEAWDSPSWSNWTPPAEGNPGARFANLQVDLKHFVEAPPVDARMAWERDRPWDVPLALKLPEGDSLLFESEGPGSQDVVEAINTVVVRLLTTSPVGRVRLSLIDPVGLGQSFAGLMHLADYDEQLVNRRIWTQATQIDQCLKDLTEHMEKVTQMYLRNEYETLADYNKAAGNIAEKYHVLVVADFPVGFSESALRRLQSIAVSGPRCGVFLLLHRDTRQPVLDEAVIDDLRQHCQWIEKRDRGYHFGAYRWAGVKLTWDRYPAAQQMIGVIHQIGRASVDSNRVEVPFQQVVPSPDEMWTLETSESLRVPIGRTGASKLQYFVLGKGTQQHALIAGKTGSGKSTLFHVMVTNLALWCRPDQVEFYLVDFKKGVEFKCYATHGLPHARVVAIESDREFGLSVLERVDQELRRRGDLFRQHGVQDLAGYRALSETGPMPRCLVMIDEFQEYFVEDDRVAQNAAVLLDRIVRQGRAFGIHVILGSQTLGGAYTLARTTFAQMVVRIALQCDEADSYLIMDENNAAPRLLSRPGEGIYNDSGGAVEGNSPFQTVWLSDAERDQYLGQVATLVHDQAWDGGAPVVFEGNAPARVEENRELAAALRQVPQAVPNAVSAWLGAPNSIKGPTEALFSLQNGSHLLVLGQNEELGLSLTLCSLISLAAQYPREAAEFVILDSIPDHSPQREMLDRVISLMPQRTTTLRDRSLESLMGGLDEDLSERAGGGDASPAKFLVVIGLQAFKKLKPEDEFSFSSESDSGETMPGDVFDRLIREGSSLGIRALVTVDSYSSSQRFLSRKALTEFEMRVLFQMSANDSAALIDSTKASQLGLHRALFYNDRKGYLETFRPYAMPSNEWLSEVGQLLAADQGDLVSGEPAT